MSSGATSGNLLIKSHETIRLAERSRMRRLRKQGAERSWLQVVAMRLELRERTVREAREVRGCRSEMVAMLLPARLRVVRFLVGREVGMVYSPFEAKERLVRSYMGVVRKTIWGICYDSTIGRVESLW